MLYSIAASNLDGLQTQQNSLAKAMCQSQCSASATGCQFANVSMPTNSGYHWQHAIRPHLAGWPISLTCPWLYRTTRTVGLLTVVVIILLLSAGRLYTPHSALSNPSFPFPSSSPSKARFPLPELTTRVKGPSWRVTGFHYPSTRAHVSTSRVDGPCYSGRQLG